MTTFNSAEVQSTEPDERDVRALTEFLTVLPEAPGMFSVVSQSGKSYTVDVREGACTCPDFEYRNSTCKHLRRVAFATGAREIPEDFPADAIDEFLGRHVKADVDAVAITDGGVVEADDGAEVLTEEATVEYTYHVEAPEQGGEEYVRCEGCGAEILTKLGGQGAMIHREGCPAVEGY